MHEHLRIETPLSIGFALALVGIIGGGSFGLYSQIPYFDKILHVLGGVSVAWATLALLQNGLSAMRPWQQFLIIISAASLVGVVWEFAEYIGNFSEYTRPLLYKYFHGGDLADTLGDLAADLIGGGVFSLWALRQERR